MPVTVEEALKLLLSAARPLGAETVPLSAALGRTLRKSVTARTDQPPFDRSPLDGYALRAADLVQAAPEHPVRLRVVDKLYAGDLSHITVGPGQAVRLMTGAMVPAGADCVLRQEDTDLGEEAVTVFQSLRPGQNLCRKGEEYAAGEVLLPAGTVLDAAALAVAAGTGVDALSVTRPCRAAVLTTGDEVCPPGAPLPPGKIYDVNSPYLSARLHALGARAETALAGDSLPLLVSALDAAAQRADLLLTTGGVSVGQKDLLETAALAWGAELLFHGVDMKPGMPTLCARKGSTLLLGLSGNPFSAAVAFELLVPPLLTKLAGARPAPLPYREATAADPFPKPSPTRRFLRGRLQDGLVSIPQAQANGQLRSMVGCNCLIDLPAGSGPLSPGDRVRLIPIP